MARRYFDMKLEKKDVTEHVLQVALRRFRTNPEYICENLYVFKWESDFLLKTRSGLWIEFECKISLSDFKHDFVKSEKHCILKDGFYWWVYKMHGREFREKKSAKRPNKFYYCVPWFLQEKVQPLLPEYAGLVVVNEHGDPEEVVKAPSLHNDKYSDDQFRLTEKFYYNWRNEVAMRENRSQEELINKLRGELSLVKDEFKAVTGMSFTEYINDAL